MGQRERQKRRRRRLGITFQGGTDADGNIYAKEVPGVFSGWLIWVHLGKGPQLFKFTTIKKERNIKRLIRTLKLKYGMVFTYTEGWSNMAHGENIYEPKENETRVQDEDPKGIICYDELSEWGPEQQKALEDHLAGRTKKADEALDEEIKYDRNG